MSDQPEGVRVNCPNCDVVFFVVPRVTNIAVIGSMLRYTFGEHEFRHDCRRPA